MLYEATLGPPTAIEAPALNPTSGVKVKAPVVLDYRKDPTRPGGGVFVAHGSTNKRDLRDLPEGLVINASSDDDAAGSEDGKPTLETSLMIVMKLDEMLLLFIVGDQEERTRAQDDDGEIIAPPTSSSAPLVNFTPLNVGGSAGRSSQNYNVNPTMNMQGPQPGSVQVMNMLDASQSGSSMADLALADNGFLEGLPGGMFDWSESFL